MKRLLKLSHRSEKGFTLIELLIVIAILGIIAAIVVPNVSGFMSSGTLNAANTEAQNVKTAAVGYLAENGVWPGSSDDVGDFLEGNLKATYEFGGDSIIDTADNTGWGIDIHWDSGTQTWKKGAA